jgi:hypothetical protein
LHDLLQCAEFLQLEPLTELISTLIAHNLQKCHSLDNLRKKVLLPETIVEMGKTGTNQILLTKKEEQMIETGQVSLWSTAGSSLN